MNLQQLPHQKWLALHNKLDSRAVLLKVRDARILRPRRERLKTD
jgi:hypothetical protein